MQGRQDLNLQPAVLETAALPVELHPSAGRGADPGRPGPRATGKCTAPGGAGSPGCPTPRGRPRTLVGEDAGMATAAPPSPSAPHVRDRISARIGGIAESATLAVDAKAK